MEHGSLVEALLAAQQAFDAVRKQSNNPHFKSKYADLATVIDAVLPALNAHGILVTQPVVRDEGGLVLRTTLSHVCGESVVSEVPLPTPADWQKWGSAMTYARRYTLMALVGVAPEEDDGNSAQGLQPRQHAKPAPAPEKSSGDRFVEDIDRIEADARQNEMPVDPPDMAKVTERGKEIAAALRDHGGMMVNLESSWRLHEDEIMTMPVAAQKGLRRVFDEQCAELETPNA